MSTASNGNSIMIQGRIVWSIGSNLFEGRQKSDMNTKKPIFGADGKPVVEYGFGLAIPKIDPRTGTHHAEYVKIYQALMAEALTLFPSGQVPPTFAMKYKDGDGVDDKGVPFSQREGYAGHIVLACTTQLPIKFFKWMEGIGNALVNEGVKTGDYVNVQLNIKAHPAVGQSKAGLYVNPSAVQLIQAGKEIVNTPSGDQLFGQVAPSYSGEVIPAAVPPMGMPGQQPSMAAPVQPAYPQGPAQLQQAPAAPYHNVLPQHFQPQQGMPPQQPQYPQNAPAAMPQGLPPQQWQQPQGQPAMPAMMPPH